MKPEKAVERSAAASKENREAEGRFPLPETEVKQINSIPVEGDAFKVKSEFARASDCKNGYYDSHRTIGIILFCALEEETKTGIRIQANALAWQPCRDHSLAASGRL